MVVTKLKPGKLSSMELGDIKDHLAKFPPMMTRKQISEALGYSPDKIRGMMRYGNFPQPVRKNGREWEWSRRSILDWWSGQGSARSAG